jgi:hypothetical protein
MLLKCLWEIIVQGRSPKILKWLVVTVVVENGTISETKGPDVCHQPVTSSTTHFS